MNRTFSIIIGIGAALIFGVLLFVVLNTSKSSPEQKTPVQPVVEKEIKIIAFGDSLTAGYNLPAGESYPAQLEAKLNDAGYSVKVINSGVSGETTRGNLERAAFIRSQNPNMVLLGIGGNDALRALPVTETKINIEKTVQILQSGENPPKVLLLQMQAPLNAGNEYKKAFDKIYTDTATTYGLDLVPFITEEIFFNTENLLADGIHLNKKGYGEVVEEYVFPAVVRRIPLRDQTRQ